MAKHKNADLLARVPPSATRVKVQTAKGDRTYKAKEDILDSDTILTNKKGDPIVMRGKPGRKAAVDVGPVNDVVKELLKRKNDSLEADPILVTIKKSPESPDVLHEVIRGLGEEQASLRFEREEAAREGKDTSRYSSRRVQALRATAETWLKRMDQMSSSIVDLDSPVYEALFGFTITSFKQAMTAARMRPEEIETVFSKFSSIVDAPEWKNEAIIRMKKAGG